MDYKNLISIFFPLFFFIFLILERIFPYKSGWQFNRRDFFSFIKYYLAGLVGFKLGSSIVEMILPKRFFCLENHLPIVFTIISGFLFFEMIGYIIHRYSHKNHYLKSFHLIHHLPDKLNALSNFTVNSFFILVFSIITQILMWLFGFPPYCFIFSLNLMAIINIFNHANIAINIPFLDLFLITPKIHRIHHNKNFYNKKNFSLSIPLWDFIFKTYCSRIPTDETLGLKESNEYPQFSNVTQCNLYPLKRLNKILSKKN